MLPQRAGQRFPRLPARPGHRRLTPSPAPTAERIHALDALRGFALAGVLLANLMFAFRVPTSGGYLPEDSAASVSKQLGDLLVEAVVQLAVQGKALTLFSVLFGVGLAIQFERFSRRGDPNPWLARRLAVLAVFGIAHLTLLWNGDILTEYALSGFIVLLFLGARSTTIAGVALVLYAIYLVAPALPFYPPWPSEAVLLQEYSSALQAYGSGSWTDIRRYSLHEWAIFSPIYVSLFTVTPALLMAGVLLWRSGVLRDLAASRPILRRAMVAGLGIGLPLTVFMQWSPPGVPLVNFVVAGLAPAVMAMGYGAAILLAVEQGRAPWFMAAFAATGRMAFTNYIVQSIVFTTVFYGYGLGLMGKVSAPAAFAGGCLLFALQVLASLWWLAHWRFGPLEWLWRSATYGRLQPMRRTPA